MVVSVGFTVTLPSTPTAPTPLPIDTLSAPVVVQLKVAVPPAVIEVGVAEKLSMGGAGLAATTVITTVSALLVAPWLSVTISSTVCTPMGMVMVNVGALFKGLPFSVQL